MNDDDDDKEASKKIGWKIHFAGGSKVIDSLKSASLTPPICRTKMKGSEREREREYVWIKYNLEIQLAFNIVLNIASVMLP